jgi:hypothetical protein
MAYPPVSIEKPKQAEDFLRDVSQRQEFYQFAGVIQSLDKLSSDEAVEVRQTLRTYRMANADIDQIRLPGLRLHGSQMFVSNFNNPHSPYNRILLNWKMGMGKTIGMILIVMEFVKYYRRRQQPVPTIFIIASTDNQKSIMKELIRRPFFGFVTEREIAEWDRLRAIKSPTINNYVGTLKRRLSDRTWGGVFQFFGYREFANALFQGYSARDVIDPDELRSQIKRGRISINAELFEAFRRGFIVVDEIQNIYNIRESNSYGAAIRYVLDELAAEAPRAIFMSATPLTGSVKEVVDVIQLLNPTVNITEATFFEIVGGKLAFKPNALEQIGMMTAGRISYAYDVDTAGYPNFSFAGTELANFPHLRFVQCPATQTHIQAMIHLAKYQELHPTVDETVPVPVDVAPDDDEEVVDLSRGGNELPAGDLSYDDGGELPTDDLSYDDGGESLTDDNSDVGDQLAERRTDWSTIFNTANVKTEGARQGRFKRKKRPHVAPKPVKVRQQAPTKKEEDVSAVVLTFPREAPRISMENFPIYDMVFPNPTSDVYGLYQIRSAINKISVASAAWRSKNGVELKKSPSSETQLLAGSFLRHGTEDGIKKYSSKYNQLIGEILTLLHTQRGKIMVFHRAVSATGVLMLGEIFSENGIIGTDDVATDLTLCSICGEIMRTHRKEPKKYDHEFAPARFATAHYAIPDYERDHLIDAFNADANILGRDIRIFLGSGVVKEGVTFKCVRHQFILSLPVDIPTLLQVIGRVIRKDSHAQLAVDQRDVIIHILITSFADTDVFLESPEARYYREKMHGYQMVQQVEREFRRYAIDGFMKPETHAKDTIYSLAYTPVVQAKDVAGKKPKRLTFEAYEFADEEVRFIITLIRNLFGTRPVWTYDDLFAAVTHQGMFRNVYINVTQIVESSFALALCQSVNARYEFEGATRIIQFVEPYYILGVVNEHGASIVDYESFIRKPLPTSDFEINVSRYIENKRPIHVFTVLMDKFNVRYADPKMDVRLSLFEFDHVFHQTLLRFMVEGYYDIPKLSFAKQLTDRLFRLYHQFGIIIESEMLSKRGEVPADLRQQAAREAKSKPVGYYDRSHAMLFNKRTELWVPISKHVFDFKPRYIENTIVVGTVESMDGEIRFKIRPPIHELRQAKLSDLRNLRKWSSCETRPRAELEDYLIRTKAVKAPDLKKLAIDDLCHVLRNKLLANEEESRKQGGKRWFYLFNEQPPAVT